MNRLACCAVFLFASAIAWGQGVEHLKAFPAPEEGMTRYVLNLPPQKDESSHRVELIVGKAVETDEHNRYVFAGKIQAETVKGWGYTMYVVPKLGPMAGTLMGVDPKAPKVSRFITLGGEPYLIRYNSKLPVVIYVPKDVEVRYRIWSAGAETLPMKKG